MVEEHVPVDMTEINPSEELQVAQMPGSVSMEERSDGDMAYIKGWPLFLTTMA